MKHPSAHQEWKIRPNAVRSSQFRTICSVCSVEACENVTLQALGLHSGAFGFQSPRLLKFSFFNMWIFIRIIMMMMLWKDMTRPASDFSFGQVEVKPRGTGDLNVNFDNMVLIKYLYPNICNPTTRIPNSSSYHENPDCYVSGTKRAIRDPLVSKRPEIILSMKRKLNFKKIQQI